MTPPNKQPLVPALRSLPEEEAHSEHPTSERLIDYQSGWLTAEESAQIETHLRTCPECKDLLADLAAFEAHVPTAKAQPDLAAKAAWKRLREQLPEGVTEDSKIRLVPKLPPKEKKIAWWWQPQTAYAFAAGLFCGVIGLSLWGYSLSRQLDKASAPVVNGTVVNLYGEDDSTRGEEVVETPQGGDSFFFTLHSYSLPDKPQFAAYEAELRPAVKAEGSPPLTVRGLRRLQDGRFTFFLAKALPPGMYQLELFGVMDGRRQPVGKYVFRIASP